MTKIAALQLPTLSMSGARIDYYLKAIKDSGAGLVLMGEYELNSFFTELVSMPKSMINEQISHKKELMSELAKKYDLHIIAPLIVPKNGGYAKVCAKFSPKSTKFYEQNILINYEHWNEEKFFLNSSSNNEIPIFTHDRLKFAVLFGFETHFDMFWQELMQKRVDVVLVPTASTFESEKRWEKLLEIRAFLNHCYILRANRIGKAKFSTPSEFYGDSFVVSPFGEITNRLKNEEGILLAEIDKKDITQASKMLKFREIIEEKNTLVLG